MKTPQTSQYDSFVADYHWLYSDRVLSGGPFMDQNKQILSSLSPGAKILDCSCGIGIHALALARHGFTVQGADASPEMIHQATDRAEQEGIDIPFAAVPWRDLPASYNQEFDIIFCYGNSIGHSRNEGEMLASLKGMRNVLGANGRLLIDSRNWEKLRKDRPRFNTMGVRVRNGIRCVPLYVWNFPSGWDEEHLIEVVLVLEEGGRVSHRSYQITYYPFRHDELIDRLRQVGFQDIQSDYSEAKDVYTVSARTG